VLHTSGTTSRPNLVPLTQGNLVASARTIAHSLQLGPDDRCLNIMPLFHVHGLIGAVLASFAAGASVVCTPGFSAAEFASWHDAFAPTWYTGVPTMHQATVAGDSGGDRRPPSRLRFIRSCSSALPPTLMHELEQKFRVPVIEAYGMTEAAHQVASNPLPPRIRKPGSVGLATGTEIAIMDEAGVLLGPETTGEVVIRGAGVTSGYSGLPDTNSKAFAGGWFRTGDQGRLDTDGYLFLTGRIKEIINRGGEKVSPREIDELLLQHPAVAQAVAFAVPHPTLGEDLAAAVVLRAGQSATENELREFALPRLAGFKVPSRIVIVEAIPKGPTGKLQRIGLAEKLADRLQRPFVAPRDPVESVLADIWQEVLGIAPPGVHDNFFAAGGDSLRAARVVSRVNELFRTELTVPSVFHQPTIEQYAEKVRGTAPAERVDAVTAMFRELEGLSDAEVERLLAEENG
jgi:acyl-CoA synthetase (AMP-forming)/AMP-acid ligase II